MDGNGRWASKRFLPRIMGHKKGADAVKKTMNAAREFGVEYLTLYAFSSENWKRPQDEVASLMNLLVDSIKKYTGDFIKKRIRFMTIGDISALPEKCQAAISEITEKTKDFRGSTLVLALNYGSRDELVRAVNKLKKSTEGRDATWDDVSAALDTADIPAPDLLIRTSGEMRLSNFMMLQAAYSELYFTDTLWPDFDKNEFKKALDEYAKRERRYGLTTEQIKK